MRIVDQTKELLAGSPIFNFNLLGRDAWIAAQAALLPDGSRVLDAGAGSCPYRVLFSHCDYETQDFSNLHNEQLRHGGYGEIDYVCDVAAIPVPENYFDAILCTEVLEHVPDPVKVIYEFARILKPEGKLILTAPLGSGIHQEPYHYYGGYTPFWFDKYLGEAGFGEITIEANGGSLKAFAQESIRFLRMTRPFKHGMPILLGLLWFPVWLLLAPMLGFVVPLASHLMDSLDTEQRFTVGYHVTAKKLLRASQV